ncbi:MAG: SDR family oxidoreductase [Pseudomonadota bacterium]
MTGGSGDIGRSIALALANAEVDVAISFVGHRDGAESCVAAIKGSGRRGDMFQLDQRDASAAQRVANDVAERFGPIEILVNNAAWNVGIPFPDLDSLDADTWDRVLETNLRGPYLLTRAFADQLKRYGNGRVVNIASTAGLAPGGSSIAYASSKAGLIHLTHCLAVALAPRVTVNCVAPGLVEGTRMAARLPEETAKFARSQAVLGQVGSATDIANQVVTFCRTDTVTGQIMVVDGGMPGAMR